MLGFLFVVAFLVAINAVFAGTAYALYSACIALAPNCLDLPLVPVLIGVVAVAVAVVFARAVILGLAGKRRQHRGAGSA